MVWKEEEESGEHQPPRSPPSSPLPDKRLSTPAVLLNVLISPLARFWERPHRSYDNHKRPSREHQCALVLPTASGGTQQREAGDGWVPAQPCGTPLRKVTQWCGAQERVCLLLLAPLGAAEGWSGAAQPCCFWGSML